MELITGTLIWYYHICPREVWLMAHELSPEQDNPYIEIGRLIHKDSYPREEKGFETKGMKVDILQAKEGHIVIGEVKKSSRFLKSATMQLAYYLYRLKETGAEGKGELLIPKERKRIKVELTPELESELEEASSSIKEIISREKPPEPVKIRFCNHCAYKEFCWI